MAHPLISFLTPYRALYSPVLIIWGVCLTSKNKRQQYHEWLFVDEIPISSKTLILSYPTCVPFLTLVSLHILYWIQIPVSSEHQRSGSSEHCKFLSIMFLNIIFTFRLDLSGFNYKGLPPCSSAFTFYPQLLASAIPCHHLYP